MDALFIVAFLVFAVASAIGGWLRVRRRGEAEAVAARAGLLYAGEDPFDCTRVAFPLFRKGDGRGAENVMWRADGDPRPVRVFDYWYYDERRNQNGTTSRHYERYTCATALIGGSWPPLTVTREGLLEKVVSTLAVDDIDFESEEFNRLFTVRCDDKRFASALIDPQMMEFLLSTRGELAYEVRGRWLLVWSRPVPAKLMPGLFRVCEQFIARVPPVVWDLYPTPFLDENGELLPDAADPWLGEPAPVVGSHDPFDVLAESPFDALSRPDRPEYDLDGNVIAPVTEDPWRDVGGSPLGGRH